MFPSMSKPPQRTQPKAYKLTLKSLLLLPVRFDALICSAGPDFIYSFAYVTRHRQWEKSDRVEVRIQPDTIFHVVQYASWQ